MVKVPTNNNIKHDITINTVFIDSDASGVVLNKVELDEGVSLILEHDDPLPAWISFKQTVKNCTYPDFVSKMEWSTDAYAIILSKEQYYQNIGGIERISRIAAYWAAGINVRVIASDLSITPETVYNIIRTNDLEEATGRKMLAPLKKKPTGNKVFTDEQEDTIEDLKAIHSKTSTEIIEYIEKNYGVKIHRNTLLKVYKRVEARKKAVLNAK